MSNYYETARTNYFRVKDEPAFRAWVAKWNLECVKKEEGFAVFPPRYDDGGFNLYDEEQDDTLDIADEIAAHLADGSVAVVMGAGHEKSRYVAGWSVAINSKGESVRVNLDDIYELAQAKLGGNPTRAEY